jgi:DNA-binding protein YbaB
MLDGFKNMAAMANLVRDLPRIKARLGEVRTMAENTRGAVTVVASCKLTIESVRLEPALVAALAGSGGPESQALAAELIREATNLALERARQSMMEALAEAARDLNLPVSPEQLKELL